MIRVIRKWLKAGVMEAGEWSATETGTPQGSVVSPTLDSLLEYFAAKVAGQMSRRKVPTATMICSSPHHPVWQALERWGRGTLVQRPEDAPGGDVLFLVSCSDIVRKDVRDRYQHTLVLHAADLPTGRGWSPHIWQVLEGGSTIVISMLEAADSADSGDIWRKELIQLQGHELYDEINELIFAAELRLMDYAMDNCGRVVPQKQVGEPTYYRKRTPADSELDPNKSIAAQFNLLRVADPERYPAFVVLNGVRYNISIRKAGVAGSPSQ
jgi:methionyl-tRNA formyltransferase